MYIYIYIYIYIGRFSPFLQAMKSLRVSRGIALIFLGPRHQMGWGVSPTPRPTLPPGKTRYPLYRRLGGPRAGLDGRKISSPPGFDTGPSSPQSVAIPTELLSPQLRCIRSQNHRTFQVNPMFIKGVCTNAWTNYDRELLAKNKERISSKHMCRNKWPSSLTERLHATINN